MKMFSYFVKKLNILEDLEDKIQNKDDSIVRRIKQLKERYEIALLESGDYPRGA